MHCWRHKTPLILRATVQWFAGMDEVPGYRGVKPPEPLRATALRGIEATRVLSRLGQGAPARHDRQPAGLDAVAPAPVGRADAVLHPPGDRRAAPALARAAGGSRAARGARRHRSLAVGEDRGPARRGRGAVREGEGHAGRLVRFRLDALHRPARLARGRERVSRRSLPGRLGPASRLVPFLAAGVLHAERDAAVPGASHARLLRRRRRPQDEQVQGQRGRAAEDHGRARRRHPAAVGRGDRLLGRAFDLARDPEARRRVLPPHPQHAAFPAGESRRFRSRARRAAG